MVTTPKWLESARKSGALTGGGVSPSVSGTPDWVQKARETGVLTSEATPLPSIAPTPTETPKPGFQMASFNEETGNLEPMQFNIKPEDGLLRRVLGTAFNVPSQAVTTYVNRLADVFEKPKTTSPILEKGAQVVKVGTSVLNLIPQWMAFTTGLEAAKEVPVIKYPAKAASKVFETLGGAGGYVGQKGLEIAPISEEAKSILQEPVVELSSLAAQLGGAHYGLKGLGYGKEVVTGKKAGPVEYTKGLISEIKKGVEEVQKSGGEIDLSTARKIVSDASKKAILPKVKEQVINIGGNEIATQDPIVFRNLLKNNENINYEVVKDLGKLDGKPKVADFTWDYNTQKGTIRATSKATAADIAHEIGHLIDKGKTDNLSTLFADTAKNREAINGELTRYAVEKLGEKAESAKITDVVNGLLDNFKAEIKKTSTRDTLNEQFADAVKSFYLNPEKAKAEMPNVAPFIEYSLNKKGLLADIVKQNETAVKQEVTQGTVKETPIKYSNKLYKVKEAKAEKLFEGAVSEEAVAKAKQLIEKEGIKTPVVVDKATKSVMAGGEFVRAAKELGLETIPIIEVKGFTPERAGRAYNAAKGQVRSSLDQFKTGRKVTSQYDIADRVMGGESMKDVITEVAKKNNFYKGERESITFKEAESMADLLNIKPEELVAKGKDSLLHQVEVKKLEQAAVDLAQQIANTDRSTPEGLAKARNSLLSLEEIVGAIEVNSTRVAQALNARKSKLSAREAQLFDDVLSMVDELKLESKGNVREFTKKLIQKLEPTNKDKIMSLWYSSMLSGTGTFAKNIVSNTINGQLEILSAMLRNPKEAGFSFKGYFEGLTKGAKEAKDIMKEGATNKFNDTLRDADFTGDYTKWLNIHKYVGRALGATDAIFREAGTRFETYGQAREIAKGEGYKGSAINNRAKEIINEWDAKNFVPEEAASFGARTVYAGDPQGLLGTVSSGLASMSRKQPLIRIIVPFTRVVANVLNQTLDYTPIGIKRAMLEKGGLLGDYYKNPLTARQRSQQLSRAILGTTAMATLASYAAEGLISGNGPDDGKKRSQLMATGWRPNSVKIGDTWYPYQNWAGLAAPLSLVGNYNDALIYGNFKEDEVYKRTAAAVMNSAAGITDMSFLSGVGDLMSALKNPVEEGPGYIKNFVSQQATSLVPNLYKQSIKYFDPTSYETNNIWEQIQYNLGITGGLKPKINVWGDTLTRDVVGGLSPSKVTDDELRKVLMEKGVYLTVPNKSTEITTSTGDKRPMTSDEYREYIKMSAEDFKQSLNNDIDRIREMSSEDANDYVDSIVRKARERAKKEIGWNAK